MHENTHVTGSFLQAGIELDPSDSSTLDKFPGAAGGNVAEAAV